MTRRIALLWIFLLLVAAGAVSAVGQEKKKTDKPDSAKAEERAPSTGDTEYVIGPEDVLHIDVWKEPEISSTVPVRPDGKISVPLLNDIQAAGYSPMELTAIITQKLKKYLEDPRVTVTVTAINSRRIFIIGQVARPGAFPLLPDMTVLQALSSAGGFSQYADTSHIYVLRTENGAQKRFAFNYKEVVRGQKTEQNVLLKPGDTIVIP